MDENNCDSKSPDRTKSPEKRAITASVGSYASVLKGREKNIMSGKLSGINCSKLKFYEKLIVFDSSYSSFLCFEIHNLESDKCRDLSEAIEFPTKTMFEEVQFPPVTTVHAE